MTTGYVDVQYVDKFVDCLCQVYADGLFVDIAVSTKLAMSTGCSLLIVRKALYYVYIRL